MMKKRGLAAVIAAILVVTGAGSSPAVSYAAGETTKFPTRFDLREQGVVTPVKSQGQFGTCWSFGATAAAETSILSSLGETYASFPIDLSEKHLAWFSVHPITQQEDPAQAGEGVYCFNPDDPYNTGGANLYATSIYSSGCGPVSEALFPYMGKQGITQYEWALTHKDEIMSENIDSFYEMFVSDYPKEAANQELFGYFCEETYQSLLKYYADNPSYAAEDDWTIDEQYEGYPSRLITGGYVLKNGNILPNYQIYDDSGEWRNTSQEAVAAVKQELLNGRAVSIAYAADVALAGQEADETYMNYDNYAQYTDECIPETHAVTIVGWDDNYPRTNFNEAHRPASDGAWIVKNSWGSQTDSAPGEVGYMDWGTVNADGLHTGYFYLSYYDKTITDCETMEFTQNLIGADSEGFNVYAYDYMPSSHQFYEENTEVMKSANVFTADNKEKLISVSTKTSKANARVKFEIYALGENAVSPEDGEKLASFSANFEYAGYHRVDLEKPVTLKKGQKFAIVVSEYVIADDGTRHYCITANSGIGQESSAAFGSCVYSVAVVNPGESYFFSGHGWSDGTEIVRLFQSTEEAQEYGLVLDNFSIKAYTVAAK